MAAAKKVSAAAVSRALTAAGLTRSMTEASRVRGWRIASPGFYTESRYDGSVQVWWTGLSDERATEDRMKAAEVLGSKGYSVAEVAGPGLVIARPA